MFYFNLVLFALNLAFGIRGLVRKDYGIFTWLNLIVAAWCGYDVVRAF